MQEVAGGLRGELEYNTDLFDATTMSRLAVHLNLLLAGAAAAPGAALSALSLLTPEERHQTLIDWNDTGSTIQETATVHGLFAAQAAATPDAVALVFAGAEMSYRELDRRANRLAHRLQGLGVGPEVAVALRLERSFELVIATLAVLAAGGFYVPLDPRAPQPRLALMLEDSGAPVLLTAESLRELSGEDGSAVEDFAAPGHLAYVMYTLGSTGRPKGVSVPHRAIVRLVRPASTAAACARFAADETFLQLAPASFDAATFEIWRPLLNGGRPVSAGWLVDGRGRRFRDGLPARGARRGGRPSHPPRFPLSHARGARSRRR